jgi:hypothetical protein
MARQFDKRLNALVLRKRIENVVGWLSLLTTLVGIAERANHYVKLAEKKRREKKHPLGFRP